MGIRDSKRILDIACGPHPKLKETFSEGMDLSELCGIDTMAAKRAQNRQMVKEGNCYELRSPKKLGRKSKFY